MCVWGGGGVCSKVVNSALLKKQAQTPILFLHVETESQLCNKETANITKLAPMTLYLNLLWALQM